MWFYWHSYSNHIDLLFFIFLTSFYFPLTKTCERDKLHQDCLFSKPVKCERFVYIRSTDRDIHLCHAGGGLSGMEIKEALLCF